MIADLLWVTHSLAVHNRVHDDILGPIWNIAEPLFPAVSGLLQCNRAPVIHPGPRGYIRGSCDPSGHPVTATGAACYPAGASLLARAQTGGSYPVPRVFANGLSPRPGGPRIHIRPGGGSFEPPF